MPELVTSVQAGLNGSPGIAYGNIVGSNIANILLIAGVSALICPIVVARSALRRDAIVMLAVAAGFAVLAWAVPMGRMAGAGLVVISQDLDELMEISDRFAALNEGRLSPSYPVGELDMERIGLMMGGAHDMEVAHVDG